MTVVTKYAGTCTTLPIPDKAWLNPTNVEDAPDGVCALAIHGGFTRTMFCDDFGFAIPAGAVIDQVKVGGKHCIVNAAIELIRYDVWDGSAYHENEGWTNTEGAGCANTVWEYFLTAVLDTAAKVNAVKLRVRYVPGGGGQPGDMLPWTGYLDAVKIEVTYHVPTGEHELFMGINI